MSYVDHNNRREKTLSGAGAVLLVAGIGYVLVTGLAMNVITVPQAPLMIHDYHPAAPPPPPKPSPVVPKAGHSVVPPAQPPILTPQVVEIGTIDLPPIASADFPSWPPATADRGAASGDLNPVASQAVAARPKGTPAQWVTSDDYPAAALRAGQQGRTGFSLDIDLDGRVAGCAIERLDRSRSGSLPGADQAGALHAGPRCRRQPHRLALCEQRGLDGACRLNRPRSAPSAPIVRPRAGTGGGPPHHGYRAR